MASTGEVLPAVAELIDNGVLRRRERSPCSSTTCWTTSLPSGSPTSTATPGHAERGWFGRTESLSLGRYLDA
jgi:hypothetical protein